MSQKRIKIKNATRDCVVTVMSAEEAAQTEEVNRVPMYRVKNNQRTGLMGYARRDEALRGVIEIRVGDVFTDFVRMVSNA
jgi:hypothetical protein